MRSLAPGSRVVIVALLCALLMTIAPAIRPPMRAQAAQTATTTAALNLRQSPSTSAAILRVMPQGATVEITGAVISGWYPVTYDGTVGYASATYLSLNAPSVTPGASARVNEALNLRAGPGTSYARLMVMPAGAVVALTGESQSGFWKLTYQGQMGWASSQYMTLLDSVPSPVPSPSPISSPTATAVATTIPTTVSTAAPSATVPSGSRATVTERLNLRSGAGTNFPIITIMPAGAIVDLLGPTQSGFQQVRYAGYTGWAFGTYLSPLLGDGSVTTTTANVNLRQGPHTAQAVILVIPSGQQVILTGAVAAGFHQVRYNGVTGWVSSAYLSGTGAPPGTAPIEVPVLMYHRIASSPGLYQVTEQTLRQQVAWLAANGYQSITPDDVLNYLSTGAPLPAKPIMITIDDGNGSDVLFKQILDQYGFAGVWYLTGPGSAYPTSVIRAMDGAGQVCGHTVDHPDLTGLGYSGQYAAIQNNKAYLEGIVGHPINCFAYPYGAYNETTMSIIKDVGYTNAVDAWGGLLKFTPELDVYHLTRINLSGFYTLSEFIGLVS